MTLERQHVPFLDVDATPVTVSELTEVLSAFVAEGRTRTVVGHNLHSVTLLHSDPVFRSFYEQSDVVLIDGAPVLWLWAETGEEDDGRGPVMDYRLGSTDWIPAWHVEGLERIAVIGAGAAANTGAVARLWRSSPARVWTACPARSGTGSWKKPPWTGCPAAPPACAPGPGMPLQEQVMARRLASLPPAVYCAVGGAIEQLAGVQKLAPRWIGRLDSSGPGGPAPPPAGGLQGVRRAVGAAGPAAPPAPVPQPLGLRAGTG